MLKKFAAPPTLNVEARLTAPAIVVVPPILTLPDTDTSSSNSALPVVKKVPPIEVLPVTSKVDPKLVAPAIVTVLATLPAPDTH